MKLRRLIFLAYALSCGVVDTAPLFATPLGQSLCPGVSRQIQPCFPVEKEYSIYRAMGVVVEFDGKEACWMRVTSTQPLSFIDKPLNRVDQPSDGQIYHTWWLETDPGNYVKASCLNLKQGTVGVSGAPGTMLPQPEKVSQHATNQYFRQAYCAAEGAEGNQIVGLSDETGLSTCQVVNLTSGESYYPSNNMYFFEWRSGSRRRLKSVPTDQDMTMNNPLPSNPDPAIQHGYMGNTIVSTAMLFVMMTAVSVTAVLTIYNTCCAKRRT